MADVLRWASGVLDQAGGSDSEREDAEGTEESAVDSSAAASEPAGEAEGLRRVWEEEREKTAKLRDAVRRRDEAVEAAEAEAATLLERVAVAEAARAALAAELDQARLEDASRLRAVQEEYEARLATLEAEHRSRHSALSDLHSRESHLEEDRVEAVSALAAAQREVQELRARVRAVEAAREDALAAARLERERADGAAAEAAQEAAAAREREAAAEAAASRAREQAAGERERGERARRRIEALERELATAAAAAAAAASSPPAASTPPLPPPPPQPDRTDALAERLLQKQAELDRMSSACVALRRQLDAEQVRRKAAAAAAATAATGSSADVRLRVSSGGGRGAGTRRHLSRSAAVSGVDALMLAGAGVLRREPLARFGVAAYLATLHLFILYATYHVASAAAADGRQ